MWEKCASRSGRGRKMGGVSHFVRGDRRNGDPVGVYDLQKIAREPLGFAASGIGRSSASVPFIARAGRHSGPAYLPAVAGNIDLTILNFEMSTVASICKKIA